MSDSGMLGSWLEELAMFGYLLRVEENIPEGVIEMICGGVSIVVLYSAVLKAIVHVLNA